MSLYAPVKKASESVASFVIPGMYRVKFYTSHDQVEDGYNGNGTKFKTTGALSQVDGTPTQAKVYEDFLIPNEEADVEVFENRPKKLGGTYVDMDYSKFLKLQGVLKSTVNSIDDALNMFETAKVAWMCNLELSASSKDRDKNPVENWAEVREWFETHGGEAAKFSERDGTEHVRLTIYNDSPENLTIIESAQSVPGIRFKNTLSGFKKPVKVA